MSVQPAEYELVPQSRIRRVTAKRMLAAANEIPQVTLHAYADAEQLLACREQIPGDRKPSITFLLTRLVADSLAARPECNGTREQGEVRQHKAVSVAIAVATDNGLVAPVLKDVQSKSPTELLTEFNLLVRRARKGELGLDDLSGGTVTISNLGNHGVEIFTPIINPPQLIILGVGKLIPRLVVGASGGTDVRRHIPLSLTFDHAALDGDRAGAFLAVLCGAIERPERLLTM